MRMVVVDVPVADAELAADRLWQAGAQAVEELPGPHGHVTWRTALAESDGISIARLGVLPPDWAVDFVDVDVTPAQTWRDFAELVWIADDLVIRPAWRPPVARSPITEIAIEPGAAFGLGDHPTTTLSAAAVWRLTRPGNHMLDVGCGTGVLSIIAARRGAASVTAIDVAEAALEATASNARRNDVGVHASTTPVADIDGTFDLVVANISAPALVAMARDLIRLAAGTLVVSGLLAGRYDHVVAALSPMEVRGTDESAGWVAIELAHPGS